MKKKVSFLVVLCLFSIYALTACANNEAEDDDGIIDISPTISTTAPDNGSNDINDDAIVSPVITGGAGINNGNADDANENLTVTPRP